MMNEERAKQRAKQVDDMMEVLNNHLAIDAKYFSRRDFFYSAHGRMLGIASAIVWISDLPAPMVQFYLGEIDHMMKDLSTWYNME